jgi:hypothetical protein
MSLTADAGDAVFTGTSITLADTATDVLTVVGNADFEAGAGAITIGSLGAANFGTLTFNTTAGAVTIQEDSDTVLTGVSTAGSLALTSAGTITDATGASLTVAGDAVLVGTAITLDNADNDFQGNVYAHALSIVGGEIVLNDKNAIILTDVDTANGPITVTAGGQITAIDVASLTDDDANDITLTATAGNIVVGTVNAGTTAGDVTMTSTLGSILDDVNDAVTDVTGDVVTMTAATGVGETAGMGSLDTRANSLVVSVTGAGLVNINELDAVTLTDVHTANGPITVTAGGTITAVNVASLTDDDANDITLTATAGNIVVGTVNAGTIAGDVTMTSDLGSILDDANDAVTDVTGDVVMMVAATGVGETAGMGSLDTAANSLVVSVTGVGEINLNELDAVTLTAVGTATDTDIADENDITIVAGGTITVGAVVAGNDATPGENADVTMTSTLGSIRDDVNDDVTDVTGDVLTLTAATGIGEIGGTGSLDTRANSMVVNVTAAGLVNIDELDAVTLTHVHTFNGPITVTAGGTMIVTDVVTGGTDGEDIALTSGDDMTVGLANAGLAGTVSLTANGLIIDGTDASVNVIGKSMTFNADFMIGSDPFGRPDPLEITVNGGSSIDLWVGNQGTGFIYAFFNTVGGKSHLRVGAARGSGAIIFVNGMYAGGDPKYMARFAAAEAFAEDTPELKSRQGVFGNPVFVQDQMDINEPIAMGLVEYLLTQGYSIEGDVELPPRVSEDIEASGLGPRNTIRFGSKENEEENKDKKQQAEVEADPSTFVTVTSLK